MNSTEIKNQTIAMRNGEVRMQRDREYWTEEDRSFVRTLFSAGVPVNEIAIQLQRSENAVYQQILQMNLYTRDPGTTRKHRSIPKEPVCLCGVCSCDRSLCPLCKVSQAIQEEV